MSGVGGSAPRLLVTGASGYLGCYVLREMRSRGLPAVAWGGRFSGSLFGYPVTLVDLADVPAVERHFREATPAAVLHAGALTSVAECYRDPARATAVNVEGTRRLAELCAGTGARLVFTSTDMVFDGQKGDYREDDEPRPLSVYGRSKLAAEAVVREAPGAAVARVSLLFGPRQHGRGENFFDYLRRRWASGEAVACFGDEWRTPLSLPVAAAALVDLAFSDFAGTIHVGGPERLTRLEMARRLAKWLAVPESLVTPGSRLDGAAEPRPRDTSLDCTRWRTLFPGTRWPVWDETLAEFGLASQRG